MADAIEKVRSRLLTTDTDAWNHRLRMVLLTPILILAGGVLGLALQIELTHRGFTVPYDTGLIAAMMLTSLFVGYVVLALID